MHVAHGGRLDDVGQLPGHDRFHFENRRTVGTRVGYSSVRGVHTCVRVEHAQISVGHSQVKEVGSMTFVNCPVAIKFTLFGGCSGIWFRVLFFGFRVGGLIFGFQDLGHIDGFGLCALRSQGRCPRRPKLRVERLKAKVKPLLT